MTQRKCAPQQCSFLTSVLCTQVLTVFHTIMTSHLQYGLSTIMNSPLSPLDCFYSGWNKKANLYCKVYPSINNTFLYHDLSLSMGVPAELAGTLQCFDVPIFTVENYSQWEGALNCVYRVKGTTCI